MSAPPGKPQFRRNPPRRELAWQDSAACTQVDPEIFFPAQGQRITVGARKVCDSCPVKAECLAFALEHNEFLGVWGGLGQQERAALQRARKRAS